MSKPLPSIINARLPSILLGLYLTLYTAIVLLPHLDLPLLSYDEAWYASIARTMVENGHLWQQEFNGSAFYDHPPLGLWLMALSLSLFGESEVSVRLPSIIAGLVALISLFVFTKSKTGPWVALIPPLMLSSSLWFILRVRSGNLDIILLSLFILTLLSFERLIHKPQSPSKILIAGALVASLLLTKTLVGIGILPALFFLILTAKKKVHQVRRAALLSGLCATLGMLPWYLYSFFRYPDFLDRHFLVVGVREGTDRLINSTDISQTLLYFRSGVGKWYYPSLAGALAALFLAMSKPGKNRNLLLAIAWAVGVGLPFIFSPKTEVWHLLPLYPPLFFLIALLAALAINQFRPPLQKALVLISIVIIFTISSLQIKAILPLLTQSIEFDRKDIALKAQGINRPFAMKTAFLPAFVYYSRHQKVHNLWADPDSFATMRKCLETPTCPTVFVIDNADYDLLQERQVPFGILDQNNTYRLIQSGSTNRPSIIITN